MAHTVAQHTTFVPSPGVQVAVKVDGKGKTCPAADAFHMHALGCGAGCRAPAAPSALVGRASGLGAGDIDPAGYEVVVCFGVVMMCAGAVAVLVVLGVTKTT